MRAGTDNNAHSRVAFELQDGVVILRIDNPPVNAGSHPVRQGLLDGIEAAIANGAVGAILVGAGRCFVAGSDLREFGQPLKAPELPDVIRAIEAAPFPVVAALHGVALGGGLELSLGCDYRVAAPETMLGLPEVSLGFVPGAGGTQRLPRLVGVARAIDLICSASRISAVEAAEIGLVDALASGDVLESAMAFLQSAPRPKRLTLSLAPPDEPPAAVKAAVARAERRGKGRPNIAEAIRLIRSATAEDATSALADERSVFQDLRIGDDAFALRYLFFAERRAANVDGLDLKHARSIERVGIVGGGTMGQGIARAFLAAGHAVTVIERDDAALHAAFAAIKNNLNAQQARGKVSRDVVDDRLARLVGAVGVGALADRDLVVEAVFEDRDVKRALLGELEAVLPPDAIIATNTSYLDIDEMASALTRPERVIGLHFFSPADVMALLEIVRTAKTSDATLASGLTLARALGKQPVVAKVAEGFIGNRIYAAYRRRAELLVLDGATPHAVDRAMKAFGFAMGPFEVADLSGLDIAWAMRKRQAPTRDPRARYVTIADTLCEAGRLGRKAGKGWYLYRDGKPQPDPAVDAIIVRAREDAGIVPRQFDDAVITRQLVAAIINEAACLLAEGVAQRPSDVDVALANGYGFPRWRGGPLYWASRQEPHAIEIDLLALADAVGHGFVAGPVVAVLDQLDPQQQS